MAGHCFTTSCLQKEKDLSIFSDIILSLFFFLIPCSMSTLSFSKVILCPQLAVEAGSLPLLSWAFRCLCWNHSHLKSVFSASSLSALDRPVDGLSVLHGNSPFSISSSAATHKGMGTFQFRLRPLSKCEALWGMPCNQEPPLQASPVCCLSNLGG